MSLDSMEQMRSFFRISEDSLFRSSGIVWEDLFLDVVASENL